MEDKATLEQLQLINELDKEEKTILLKLIELSSPKKDLKIICRNILLLCNS